jgi:hypothetical protein
MKSNQIWPLQHEESVRFGGGVLEGSASGMC